MKELDITIEPDMPEQCKIRLVSTGERGGDAGHGGNACLVLSENGGTMMNYTVFVKDRKGVEHTFEDVEELSFVAEGDWELAGLVIGLMDLGRQLLLRNDVLKSFLFWRDNWR